MRATVHVLGALVTAGLCWAGAASALDQQDLERLQQTNACAGCDLSGAQMAGWRLTSLGLVGADLNGIDLRSTVVTGVDLSNANLRDADLSGAVVRQTWLRGADLTGALLARTVFVGADLTGAVGLSQFQLDQACDDRRADVTQVPIPFSQPACE